MDLHLVICVVFVLIKKLVYVIFFLYFTYCRIIL